MPNNLQPYRSLGEEERLAVDQVMRKGELSRFLGCWHEDFYGGDKVREFESNCQDFFGVKHAITVNSWTSGLIAAVGALDIEPGDEIIVSPWTMSATATAIVHWNAIPVFADIEPETFNLDPVSVERCITDKTRAILSVDIFGHSADISALQAIADRHNLKIISDTAQAPAAKYQGRYAGTLTDIGGYSLNYHKHIHTGEGGVIVTDDDALAERMRMIRNHGEVVVKDRAEMPINNMLGFNFRLGELEAAIGIEQLKKLASLTDLRVELAELLTAGLEPLAGLKTPVVKANCSHVYYVYPLVLDVARLGCTREQLVAALQAEGVAIMGCYQNIHLLPIYQQKQAYGHSGIPWTLPQARKDINYQKGICPTAEWLQDEAFIGIPICAYDYSEQDMQTVVEAFHKVWRQLDKVAKIDCY